MPSGQWRFEQSQSKLRDAANRIFTINLDGQEIKWLDEDEDEVIHPLDQYFDIDCIIKSGNGMIQTVQAKFLSYDKIGFNSITIEYMNDEDKGIEGDWFHCAAQWYFVGYACKSNTYFDKWVILNWPAVIDATVQGNVVWQGPRHNKKDNAKASFKYIDFWDLPDYCKLEYQGDWG